MSVIVADTFRTRVAGAAVTTTEGLNVGGACTATSFVGDGSNITALSGTNIASGTVAAARVATLNQDTTGTAALAEGLTGTPDITVRNITGVAATFTGVLTYEDVTNVDSVGIVTARGGLEVGAAGVGGTVSALGHVEFVGVTTIGLGLTLTDNIQARFGNAGDLKIYHNGAHSYVDNATGSLFVKTDNQIYFQDTGGNRYADFVDGGAVKLYYSNAAENKKFETTETGTVTTGISTATSFTDDKGDLRDISARNETSQATLVAADAGKVVSTTTGGWVVPTGVLAAGDAVTLINKSGSGQTITCSAVTMYNSGDGSTVTSRTLGARGMCTIWFESSSVAYISGAGLS